MIGARGGGGGTAELGEEPPAEGEDGEEMDDEASFSTISSSWSLEEIWKCNSASDPKDMWRCLFFSVEWDVKVESGYCWTALCSRTTISASAFARKYKEGAMGRKRTLSLSLAKNNAPLPIPSVPFFFFFFLSIS